MVATLQYAYNFPTIDDQVEWYFWSTVVGLGELIALASLLVRWRRGSRLLRRQIVGFATVTVIMIAASFFSRELRVLRPRLPARSLPAFCRGHFCTGAARIVISIAIAVLQYHLYDVRLVIRRVVVYGGLTIALTALFVGVYFAAGRPLRPGRGSPLPLGGRGRGHRHRPGRRADAAAHPDRLERRFLGERGDPLRVLGSARTSSGDENTVYTTITRTVAAAVRSPSVALALHRGPQIETVSVTGAEQDAALVFRSTAASGWARCGSAHAHLVNRTAESTGRCSTSSPTRPRPWSMPCVATPSCSRRADKPWRRSPRNVRGWGATCTMASPRCWLEQGLRPRRCARE